MKDEEIVSAILGIPVKELEQEFKQHKEAHQLFLVFMHKLLADSSDEIEFKSKLVAFICAMLHPFSKREILEMLEKIGYYMLSGKVEQLEKQIDKFIKK